MTIEAHGSDQQTTFANTNYTKAVDGMTNMVRALYQESTGAPLGNLKIYEVECHVARMLKTEAEIIAGLLEKGLF